MKKLLSCLAVALIGLVCVVPTQASTLYSNTGSNISGSITGDLGSVPTFTILVQFDYTAGNQGIIVDEDGQPAPASGWNDSQLEVEANGDVYAAVWPYAADIFLGQAQPGTNTAVFGYNTVGGILGGQLDSDPIVSLSGVSRSDPNTGSQYWEFGVGDPTDIIGEYQNPNAYSGDITAGYVYNTYSVPEPANCILLALGAASLVLVRRRKLFSEETVSGT